MSVIKRVAIAVAAVAAVEVGFHLWNRHAAAKRAANIEQYHAKFCDLAHKVKDDDIDGQELISSFRKAYRAFNEDPSWVNELNVSSIVTVLDAHINPSKFINPGEAGPSIIL